MGGGERYKEAKNIKFLDFIFDVPDTLSFIYQIKEIFGDEIYKFHAKKKNPIIIDCGSNVGVSVAYFYQLYRDSAIYAFEADPNIYQYLQQNIQRNHINNVIAHNKAVWINNDGIYFASDGADGGSINDNADMKLESIWLKEFIESFEMIDFLKIDIEGAENQVIVDCKDSLHNVQNIFIEYHQRQNASQNLGLLLDILRDSGFRIYLENITKCKSPFIKRNNDFAFELQINVFAYRVI